MLKVLELANILQIHLLKMERPIAVPESRLILIYRRLEAATSRLEDMATSVDSSHPSTVAAISSSTTAPPHPSAAAMSAAALCVDPLPPSIEDFDKILDEDVKAFVSASVKVGGLVEQQAWFQKRQFVNARLTYRSRPKQWLKLLLRKEHISP